MKKRIFTTLLALVTIALYASAQTKEAYAWLDKGTLKFYYDNQRSSRQGTTFDIPWVEQGYSGLPGWSGDARVIRVEFHSLGEYPDAFWAPMMFYNMPNLEYIGNNGQYGLATLSNINFTSMHGMFKRCPNLKGVDGFKYLNTTNVKDLSEMFDGCESLEEIDLTNLPATFNTSLVTDMYYMFNGCKKLTALDLSGFNTAKLKTTYDMFNGCSNLETIFCGNDWNAAGNNISSSVDMFTGCTKLKGGVDWGSWYTNDINYANPTTGYFTDRSQLQAYAWIKNGESSKALWICYDSRRSTHEGPTYDIPWSGVCPDWTDYNNGNSDITAVYVDNSFTNYPDPLDASYMFYRMYALRNDELNNLAKCNITNTNHMFAYCNNLPSVETAKYINTANVTDMSYMFYNCSSLDYLSLNKIGDEYADCFNTSNVTNMESMFEGCSKVRYINMAKFNTAKVTNMKNMFKGCGTNSENNGFKSLSVSSFNTSSVTDMTGMFSNCTTLQTIYASDEWSTASVTSSANMFQGCTLLRGGNGTYYSPANPADKTYARIDGGTSSPGYFSQALMIDENNFPDANFRAWLYDRNYGNDAVLTPDEILNVNSINVSGQGIHDLTGIEYFTAITSLNCFNNKLVSLDLSHNTALTTLYCQNNWLTELNVSGCTRLKTLYCSLNQLNVGAMGALVESLPTITSGQGTFVVQDYSPSVNEGNSMTQQQYDAAVAKNWNVTSFNGDPFQLHLRIDESSFPDTNFRQWVIELDQQKNFDGFLSAEEISTVDNMDVSGLGISDLTGIENFFLISTLNCSQNQLKHLDLTNNTYLRTLYCYSNQLKHVHMKNLFESLPTITNGNCELRLLDGDDENEGNDLSNVSVKPATDKGWVVKNRINGQWITQASTLNESDILITKALFPDDNFRNCLFSKSYGQDGILTEDEINNISSMDVSGHGIADLRGIEVFTKLSQLNCSHNNLSKENVEYLINALPYNAVIGFDFMMSIEALLGSQLIIQNFPDILAMYGLEGASILVWDEFQNTMCKKLDIYDNRNQDEGNVVTYADQQLALSRGWVMREYKENTANKWKVIDAWVEIDEENFPDTNFRNWILRQPFGQDEKLYGSEINKVTSIDLHSENIQNLKGIENFTALENLYCHRNQIEGENMLDLMFFLPTDSRMHIVRDIIMGLGRAVTGDFDRKLYVISADNDDEQNVCDKSCVRIAKERGWKVFSLNNNTWTEYAGSENTGSGLKGDMNNDNKLTITDAVIIVDTILEKE